MKRRPVLLVLLIAVCIGGCGLNSPADRAWIPEDKYEQASGIYSKTGSLALTEEGLSVSPLWERAEINQAIYRLKKEHHLE